MQKQNIPSLFRNYAIPAMLNMVVVALYNIVDRIFIGQGAGAMAICGLALTLPCISLITAVGTLTGVGAAARIQSAINLGNKQLAGRILGNALLLNTILSLILILLFFLWRQPILEAFGGTLQTIPYASDYLTIIVPGSILTNLNFTFCNGMRAAGQPKKSAMIILTGVIINIILDPVFIFGFHLGIRGAAIATVISMCLTSLLIVAHLTATKTSFRLSRKTIKPHLLILITLIGTGMPAFIMNITTGMVNIIMNRYLLHHGGDYAIGAYGIISCYSILITMLLMGICQGMQPLVSFYYGARNIQKVWEILRIAIHTGTIVACTGFLITETTAPFLVAAFTTDHILLTLSQQGLRLSFLMVPLIGFQIIVTSFFQAVNKAPQAIVMNISRQFIFLIPALYCFSRYWGLTGIWLALPFADSMAAIIAALFLKIERSRTK